MEQTVSSNSEPGDGTPQRHAKWGRLWRACSEVENVLTASAMFFVMVLPITEIVLRQTPLGGLKATATLVQHFTLVIGMLGGALAARNGRLLSLATAENFLSGRLRVTGLILINSMNAVVAFFLCTASVAFVQAEFAGGNEFAYGIPFWVVQLILPIGFGLVALHCLIRSGENWRSRLVTLGLVAAVVGIIWKSPVEPEHLFLPLLILLFLVTALGGAIFAAIGGVALLLFWRDFFPVAVVPLKHYSLVTNPMLPTIPLFTLAGYFLAEGGASRRLVAVFRCLFGNLRGGPAIVAIVVSAFFTTFTGASGVTILALGGVLMPVLLESRYQERHALGLITGSSSLGVLFPPCLPLILYAIIASTAVANSGGLSDTASTVSMEAMFAGALLPGLLMLGLTCWLGVVVSPKSLSVSGAFSWASSKTAVWEAKWELLLPMVALVAFFSGYCTPVEAAAITALYAFIVEAWVYRDLRPLRDGVRVMTECGLLVGGVLLILGVAIGFTHYLVVEQIPDRAVAWVTGTIQSRWLFLLALNVFLLAVGCLMDIFSAIIVVVPLIVPIGIAFGVDPIHLGVIFLANLQLGYLTPPVGMNLFLASYRFEKPLPVVYRSVIPMFFVLLIGVLLITYVEPLSTALPRLLGK